jgi:hypothetical protein
MDVVVKLLGSLGGVCLSVGILMLYHWQAGDDLYKYFGYGWLIHHWKLVALGTLILLFLLILFLKLS